MSLVLLLLPAALCVVVFAKKRGWIGFSLVVLYIYPQLVLTTTLLPEYALPGTSLPLVVVNAVRLSIHLAVFVVAASWIALNPGVLRLAVHKTLGWISLLVVFSMFISCAVNGTTTSPEGAGRMLVLSVYLVSLFALLVTVFTFTTENLIESFTRYFVLLAFGIGCVSILATALYGGYADWSIRLGRPLNPGVFSAIMFLGLTLTLLVRGNLILSFFFLALIIASGSRTALLCALFTLWLRITWHGTSSAVVVALLLIPVLGWMTLGGGGELFLRLSESELYGRSDWSAGRLVTWATALETVRTEWLWGTGGRFQIFSDYLGREQRTHNGLLEGTASFGIFYAISMTLFYTYASWRSFGRRASAALPRGQRGCLQAIVLYLFIEFIFGTLYWTNLGDAFSLSSILILLLFLRGNAPRDLHSRSDYGNDLRLA